MIECKVVIVVLLELFEGEIKVCKKILIFNRVFLIIYLFIIGKVILVGV